jgi:hypothetical protein
MPIHPSPFEVTKWLTVRAPVAKDTFRARPRQMSSALIFARDGLMPDAQFIQSCLHVHLPPATCPHAGAIAGDSAQRFPRTGEAREMRDGGSTAGGTRR